MSPQDIHSDATHEPPRPLIKYVRDPEAFDFEYEVTRALTSAIERTLEVEAVHALGLTPEPEPGPASDPSSILCYCLAYPDPHEPGVGNCSATGNVICPACAAILADDDVVIAVTAPMTYLDPPEYEVILLQPCGNCGLVGNV